jgi:site-specific recombinase XerD
MRRWDGLVEGYVKECEIRGLATVTVDMRRRELDRCGTWLKHRRPRVNLELLDSELIIKYLRGRAAFRSKCLIYGVVSILRGMGEHLVAQGIWTKNPLRWIKGPRMDPRSKLPRRIGKEDMKRLWEAAEKKKPESVRMLTLCVLGILYGTGLRRGELQRLNLGDWDRENGVLKVDGQKTGRERTMPVGPGLWRCVEAYLPVRQNRLEAVSRLNETAFLIDRLGNRMSPTAITRVLHVCAKDAGIPFFGLHQFRHSCASDLLENGVKIPEVKTMLGHAAIQTTMRYIHVSSGERNEAIKKHPINDFLRANMDSTDRSIAI